MISSPILYFAQQRSDLCDLQSLVNAALVDHPFLIAIPAFFVAIKYAPPPPAFS
jgi:hypothetical protein